MTFDKEFKEAIINLPESEKDKLLLRLLKKDLNLVNQLTFRLLTDQDEVRLRNNVENEIIQELKRFKNHNFHPGWLMMELRGLSGMINEHVNTTKDKFGEISLNIYMLTHTLKNFNDDLDECSPKNSLKLNEYIVNRSLKILVLISKLHEDYILEFEDSLLKLGKLFGDNHNLMMTAIHHGFDVNWLLKINHPFNPILRNHK